MNIDEFVKSKSEAISSELDEIITTIEKIPKEDVNRLNLYHAIDRLVYRKFYETQLKVDELLKEHLDHHYPIN